MDYRIMLIKPNILVRKDFGLHSRMSPPIGLAYIAGPLLAAGCSVKIIDMVAEAPDLRWPYNETHDAYGLKHEAFSRFLEDFQPDLIGIGGFTSQFCCIKKIVAVCKLFNRRVPVVLGGANATALPAYVLGNTDADYVLQGEAEDAMLALVRALHSRKETDLEGIDGLAFRQADGNIVINKKKKFISDIDAITWPARELLQHDAYLADGVSMPVISSRSCPGRCTFCSVHIMTGYKWRSRDPYDVADEIEHMVKKWNYRTVSIFDDAANVKPDRLITICQEVVRRKLGIRLIFPSSLIIRFITKDLLFWMKKAGSVGLSLPIEHANEKMRNKVIGKNLDMAHVDQVLDWCRELRLLTVSNFVVGMPGENDATLRELEDYVRSNADRMDAVSVYLATPFPGTSFYEQCLSDALIQNPEAQEFLDFDTYTVHIATREMSAEELVFRKKKIEQTFLEARGPGFPADYIRKIFRKPDEEGLRYLDETYFA